MFCKPFYTWADEMKLLPRRITLLSFDGEAFTWHLDSQSY